MYITERDGTTGKYEEVVEGAEIKIIISSQYMRLLYPK